MAIGFVIGPFIAIWFSRTAWVPARFFTMHYWIAWAVYLVLAYLLSPRPSPDTPGLWSYWAPGAGFYWRGDPWNHFLLAVALVLVPGKIVLAAIFGLPRYLFQKR